MIHPTYEEDGQPPALPWSDYAQHVQAEYAKLLDGAPDKEGVFQAFIEQHPSLLPQEKKRHDGWPWVVLTQPAFRSYRNRKPDFMLVEEDSGTFRAVFVEIETPAKRYTKADLKPADPFNQAVEQVDDWRRWFHNRNQAELFRDEHDLWFRDDFEQRYLLIYGRSTQEPAGFDRVRRDREKPDFRIMSFDRLTPLADQANFVTVRRVPEAPDDHRILELAGIPACYEFNILAPGLCARVRPNADVIRNAPFMPSGRADYILKRWEEVAQKGKNTHKRPPRRPPP